MLTVADLPRRELAARLAGPGLVLRTGPFANRIRSDVPLLLDGIALLYADYPVDEPGGFADFHLSLHRAGGLRRWFRPQVRFAHEGMTPFKPLPLAQAYPMFEWVMNWCVTHRAHSYLIIHAAVLERHGRAVVLPAPPGSGKSTLCAALVTRGWRLLSDEMTLVRLEDGAVLPLPRPVSLKNGSIDVIRAYAPDAVLSPPVENTTKGTIAHLKAPPASIARAFDPARPAFIVFPRYEAGAATSLSPLPKARAFMGVAENAFNYEVLGVRGFTALGCLIDATAAFEFRYSKLDEAVALFERLAKDGA
jgi:HprK-related kinase A